MLEETIEEPDKNLLLIKPLRIMLYLSSLMVLLAGFLLTVFAEQTETWFAWTINPPLSAAYLGVNYFCSFILALMAAREKFWARVRVSVYGWMLFSTLTCIPTFMNLSYYHLDSWTGWLWIFLYVAIPLTMGPLIFFQLKAYKPEFEKPILAPLSKGMGNLLLVTSLVVFFIGLVLFLAPSQLSKFFPWEFTQQSNYKDAVEIYVIEPFVGIWLITFGTVGLLARKENDAMRIVGAMTSIGLVGLLQLLTLFRIPLSIPFRLDNIGSLVFIIIHLLFLILGVYVVKKASKFKNSQN